MTIMTFHQLFGRKLFFVCSIFRFHYFFASLCTFFITIVIKLSVSCQLTYYLFQYDLDDNLHNFKNQSLMIPKCLEQVFLPDVLVFKQYLNGPASLLQILVLKKRKKKEALLFTSHVDNIILEESEKLIQLSFGGNFLDDSNATSEDWFENNGIAQEAAKNVPSFSHSLHSSLSYQNKSNLSVVTEFKAEEYILPPWSTFHISDVNDIDILTEKYDFILLDPAWENKSVRRKKRYETLNLQSIDILQIKKLCNPGCLIAVWVTNNKKQIKFVKEELFTKWNVISSVIWHWVKITQKGKFVYSFDSHHKKPYENLILGRISNKETCYSKELLPHKIIVSVPSSIHSHKPPLVEILQPYLPKNPKCLELFARYLLPGWTSVGNEVLKLQNVKLFEKFSRN